MLARLRVQAKVLPRMKQVIVIKLEPSQEQYKALLATIEAFNRGCQYAADVAYEKRLANKIALQPFVYGTLRSEFGLSSQMAIRTIAKAVEAYKRDRRIYVKFDVHGAMVYDPRNTSRTCLACGHCAKENRRSQSEFHCKECGFQANAELVGSMNIRRKGLEARASVIPPMVSANACA